MSVYYNEHDPYAAQWLRNLIQAGWLPAGDVDERDIRDVRAKDLAGYSQCHFFAGIGGWPYALRLAGVPDDYPVWTGSPPCQSFSVAGKRRGKDDERHLWPVFFELIRECRPAILFGEQVENAIAHGWLDDLQDDLEGEGYACGATCLSACGVGSPHIRQRLLFCAVEVSNPEVLPFGGGKNHKTSVFESKSAISESGNGSGANIKRGNYWEVHQPPALYVADGLPTALDGRGPISRIGTLKGFGNAIVPQVAQVFVESVFESIGELNDRAA